MEGNSFRRTVMTEVRSQGLKTMSTSVGKAGNEDTSLRELVVKEMGHGGKEKEIGLQNCYIQKIE